MESESKLYCTYTCEQTNVASTHVCDTIGFLFNYRTKGRNNLETVFKFNPNHLQDLERHRGATISQQRTTLSQMDPIRNSFNDSTSTSTYEPLLIFVTVSVFLRKVRKKMHLLSQAMFPLGQYAYYLILVVNNRNIYWKRLKKLK